MTIVELMGLLVKAGAVFGLLALTVRMLRRLDGGKRSSKRVGRLAALAGVKGGRKCATMDIVERKPLGRSSSVVLLRVRDQHWVVGVTEQHVQVLLEVDVEPEEEPVVDLRGTSRARAQAPGWADLGRMLRQRVPLLRTTSTEVALDELAGPSDEAEPDEDDFGPFEDALCSHDAEHRRAHAIGRARR